MSKKKSAIIKPPPYVEVIKNVEITKLNIKLSWELQLVTLQFSDPDRTLTRTYQHRGTQEIPPSFTIPFFKGLSARSAMIHTSLIALGWVLDQWLYLKAEGALCRVKANVYHTGGANITAIGNILQDRWISEAEGLPNIPYPYCLNRSAYDHPAE